MNKNYHDVKRKSINSIGDFSSGSLGRKRKKKTYNNVSFGNIKNKSKGKIQIPDIQIKVGVQNNHYNYCINSKIIEFYSIDLSLTNTISECEEDDEKYAVIGIKNTKKRAFKLSSLDHKFKNPNSRDYKIVSPKSSKGKTSKGLPTVSGWRKNNQLYKRHNIEPPIDLRSTSRRYRDMLQTRLNSKRTSPRDKSNLRNKK